MGKYSDYFESNKRNIKALRFSNRILAKKRKRHMQTYYLKHFILYSHYISATFIYKLSPNTEYTKQNVTFTH